MIDLSKISGLPIELTDDYHLKFSSPLEQKDPDIIRKFEEVVPVLMDPEAKGSRNEMYYVYRHLYLPQDENWIAEHHLKYDVTIIPPAMLGSEYNKTVGHYHADIPGSNLAHPEMYEILHGQATILMQKMDEKFEKLISVIYLHGQAGDKIIYPPNYGHILINTGTEALVTCNWLSSDYKPLYEPVQKMQGMAYYLIKGEDGQPEFVKNEKYLLHPEALEVNPDLEIMAEFGFTKSEPMYTLGGKNPKALEFLNNPAKYALPLSAVCS